jgi:hypothetical protein
MTDEETSALEKITDDHILLKAKAFSKIEEKIDANDFIIRSPKSILMLLFIMMIINMFIDAIGFYNIDDPRMWFVIIIFSLSSLFFLFLIIIFLRFNIKIKDNRIISVIWYKKEKSFDFDYITLVKFKITVRKKYADWVIQNILIEAYHEKEKLFYLTSDNPGCSVLVSLLKNKGIPLNYEVNAV